MTTTYILISKGQKQYQNFPFQGLPKYTEIGCFGMKMYLKWAFWYENIPTASGNPGSIRVSLSSTSAKHFPELKKKKKHFRERMET
jgi:hypothetical protein